MSTPSKVAKKVAQKTKPAKGKAEPSKVRNQKVAEPEKIERVGGVESAGEKRLLAGAGGSGASAKASTAALSRARELGVDISEIKGTGTGGVITKGDVESYADQLAPVPGSMGLLTGADLLQERDAGPIGLSPDEQAAQMREADAAHKMKGAGADMIRRLSQYNKAAQAAPVAPTAMDMARLDSSLFPAPVDAGFVAEGAYPGAGRSPFDLSQIDTTGLGFPIEPDRAATVPADIPPAPSVGTIPGAEINLSALMDDAADAAASPAMDMERMADKRFQYAPPPPGAMDVDRMAQPEFQYRPSDQGAGQADAPKSNADAFLMARGLGGMLSRAAKYAKEHPYRTAAAATLAAGGAALGLANAGGGATMPTQEEMQEHERRRQEAANRAAGFYRPRNPAPVSAAQEL